MSFRINRHQQSYNAVQEEQLKDFDITKNTLLEDNSEDRLREERFKTREMNMQILHDSMILAQTKVLPKSAQKSFQSPKSPKPVNPLITQDLIYDQNKGEWVIVPRT